MTAIEIPQLDANSETARLVAWDVVNMASVTMGQVVCTVETSKAIYEVQAASAGVLVQLAQEGATVQFNVAIGYVAADAGEALRVQANGGPAPEADRGEASSDATGPAANASKRAVELARMHGVDLAAIAVEGIITERDVQEHLKKTGRAAASVPAARPVPGELPAQVRRVLLIGAGYGAMQVIDILMNDHDVRVVGCLDDDAKLHGLEIFGAPVLGPIAMLAELWAERRFDAAIVAISTNIRLRKRFYEECVGLGIPMANAVDPTVCINRGAVLGSGNVICSQCHIGVAARIGDNNFISAHNSIDHHNHWGSHITTGPACATSGAVTVGNEVKFGTGIHVQPNLTIGEGAIIASGATIIGSVPERHAVKARLTVEMVPLQPSGS